MKKLNYPEYKGYHAQIEFDSDSLILHGRIEGINDLVTFESDSAKDIINEFHSAVDDYLLFCEEIGKEPNKEYKGTFNVRIDPELHKQLSITASYNDKSLNSCIEEAVKRYLFVERMSVFFVESNGIHSSQYTSSGCSSSENYRVTPIVEVC